MKKCAETTVIDTLSSSYVSRKKFLQLLYSLINVVNFLQHIFN